MQQLFIKARYSLFIIAILTALLLYCVIAMKVFHQVNLVLISLVILSGLLIMMSNPPFRIFLVFVLSLPLSSALSFQLGFTISPAYLIMLLLVSIMLISRELWYSRSPLDLAIIAFMGVCAVSIIQTIRIPPPEVILAATMKYRGVWFRSIIQLLLFCFFSLSYFFTVHFCSHNKRRLDIVLKAYVVLAIIISAYGIYQAFASHFDLPLKNIMFGMRTGGGGYGGLFTEVKFSSYRSQATFGEPLGFGNYLLTILPLFLAFAGITKGYIDLKGRRWMSVSILVLVITISFVALFMTRARGPLVSFAVCVVLLMVLLRQQRAGSLFVYLSISIFVLVVLYFTATKFLGLGTDVMKVLRFEDVSEALTLEELTTALSFEEDYDTSENALKRLISGQRFAFNFYLVPKLFKEHPFLGVGLGNLTLHATSIFRSRVLFSPVGIWGTVLAETGILGFSIFCWMIFIYYKTMIQILPKVRNTYWAPYVVGTLTCFTGLLVHYLSWGARFDMATWFFMGISMSIVKLANQDLQQTSEDVSLADSKLSIGENTTHVVRP